jgi:quinolinate synthase
MRIVEKVFTELQKLRHVIPVSVMPDEELWVQAELLAEILDQLDRMGRRVVILKHNYMGPVLFWGVPGIAGDSLALSREAANTDADIIVFCGVKFMAETAKILNPTKTVLVPSLDSGCSLAEGITAADVQSLKHMFPGLPVVTYINTYADVKAESDVCCTSGNAPAVVKWAMERWGTKSVIFLPDKYMAGNIAKTLGMRVFLPTESDNVPNVAQNPTIVTWDARCYVHEQFTPDMVADIRRAYPGAIVLAHPECRPEVVAEADMAGSTSEMIKYVENSGSNQMIALLTECSMADNILSANPALVNRLIRMCTYRCKYMNTISLRALLDSLVNLQYEVTVPEHIRIHALSAVQRMLEIK